MKTNRRITAVPLAVTALAMALSSCVAPPPASVPESAVPLTAPSEATIQNVDFTTSVTTDLKPFVASGETWAIKAKGKTLFAGNKAVSVESKDPSTGIKVSVINLDDGTTIGSTEIKRIAPLGESAAENPAEFGIIHHDGKDFLSVTQRGALPDRTDQDPEGFPDIQVSFVELDDPSKASTFSRKDTSTWGPAWFMPETNGIRQAVPLTDFSDSSEGSDGFYATPSGITQVDASGLDEYSTGYVLALTQGQPLVFSQHSIGGYELRVPHGWDVVKTLSDNERDPLGDMEILAMDGDFISFDYTFAVEMPYHGTYVADLKNRTITRTSDAKGNGFTVKGVRDSPDGDFLVMKDSAYNKRTGKLVSFKGNERILLGVANQDGTRAYGTRDSDHSRVLVDLTTKEIQDVESPGDEASELPAWITPKNTVVFRDRDTIAGVRTG